VVRVGGRGSSPPERRALLPICPAPARGSTSARRGASVPDEAPESDTRLRRPPGWSPGPRPPARWWWFQGPPPVLRFARTLIYGPNLWTHEEVRQCARHLPLSFRAKRSGVEEPGRGKRGAPREPRPQFRRDCLVAICGCAIPATEMGSGHMTEDHFRRSSTAPESLLAHQTGRCSWVFTGSEAGRIGRAIRRAVPGQREGGSREPAPYYVEVARGLQPKKLDIIYLIGHSIRASREPPAHLGTPSSTTSLQFAGGELRAKRGALHEAAPTGEALHRPAHRGAGRRSGVPSRRRGGARRPSPG
jgi:hypothetical protein